MTRTQRPTPQTRYARVRHDNIFETRPSLHTQYAQTDTGTDTQTERAPGKARERHTQRGTQMENTRADRHTESQTDKYTQPHTDGRTTALTSLCACFNGRFLGLGILPSPPINTTRPPPHRNPSTSRPPAPPAPPYTPAAAPPPSYTWPTWLTTHHHHHPVESSPAPLNPTHAPKTQRPLSPLNATCSHPFHTLSLSRVIFKSPFAVSTGA